MSNPSKTSKRFKQTCPLNLQYFPTEPCPLAINKINKEKDLPTCEWHVCDSESNYCFWYWLSKPENQKTHTLKEVGDLTNTTLQNIKQIETYALKRFSRHIKQLSFVFSDTTNENDMEDYDYVKEYIKEYIVRLLK